MSTFSLYTNPYMLGSLSTCYTQLHPAIFPATTLGSLFEGSSPFVLTKEKIKEIFNENVVQPTSSDLNLTCPINKSSTLLRVTFNISTTIHVNFIHEREDEKTSDSPASPPEYLKFDIEHDPVVYASEMKKFIGFGKPEQAVEIFDQWQDLGNSPTLEILNALIEAFLARKSVNPKHNLEQALQIRADMRGLKIEPNHETVVLLLKGCAFARNMKMGEQVYMHHSSYQLLPCLETNNALLGVYAASVSHESKLKPLIVKKAEDFFQFQPEKDVATENALLLTYFNAGLAEKAKEHLDEMLVNNMVDNQTFLKAHPSPAKIVSQFSIPLDDFTPQDSIYPT